MKILKIVSLLLVGSGIGIGLFLTIAKPFTPVTITYQKNSQQNYQYQQGYIDGLTSLKSCTRIISCWIFSRFQSK